MPTTRPLPEEMNEAEQALAAALKQQLREKPKNVVRMLGEESVCDRTETVPGVEVWLCPRGPKPPERFHFPWGAVGLWMSLSIAHSKKRKMP